VDLKSLSTDSITLRRGDAYYTFSSGDISIVGGSGNAVIDITQKNLMVDDGAGGTQPWIYETGDEFYCECVGIDLSGDEDNIVAQAKDLLKRFGGLVDGDFDTNWATFAAKSTPAESAVANRKSRAWVQETQETLAYALSLLEQVRLEAFVSRDDLFKLNSLHFDEFVASPTFTLRNWDIGRESFKPQIDERNNWNRAKADYAFSPPINENRLSTPWYRNSTAITAAGKEISKIPVFPNLYIESDVTTELGEMIKLASAYAEFIDVLATSRAMLKDIGDFIVIGTNIGSVDFTGTTVPGMIREIGYNPDGLGIPMRIWSFQMVPFPGYSPGFSGITGGSTATITQET
jgi:hypothetical protein